MSEWEKVRLGDVAEIYDGPHATPPLCEEAGAYFLGIPHITENGHIDLSAPRYISDKDYTTWTRRVAPQRDDVVFSYEATLNRYAIIPQNFKCCLGRRLGLARSRRDRLLPLFLYYYFFSPEWRDTVKEKTIAGATVNRLPIADFPNFPISLPPLPIQNRIAAVLSDYDAAIANCRQQIALLEEAAMRLYKEWFKDGKGEEMSAFDACEIMSGGTPSTKRPEYYEGTIPFFTPYDSHGYSCVIDTEKHLSEDGVRHCNSQLFPQGTVMVTARGTVGNVVITCEPMAMNQSCYAVRFKDPKLSSQLLHFLLKNEIKQIQKAGSSGVFDAIIVETFKLLKLTIPQGINALQISNRIKPLYDMEEQLVRHIRTLTEARDRLLPKLMKGAVAV